MSTQRVDIGSGIGYELLGHSGSCPKATEYEGNSGIVLVFDHRHGDETECRAAVLWCDGCALERPRWDLIKLNPLTLAPSILRRECGVHGWIRGGRWVSC